MAKGSVAKEAITKRILEVFEGSFINDKEIRIPFVEGGEQVQIKVALTCAKVNIDAGTGSVPSEATPAISDTNREITSEEVKEVKDIIRELNL